MSGDETFLLFGSGAASLIMALWWYVRIFRSPQGKFASREFQALAIAPLVALGGVYFVIRTAGSLDVRHAPNYLFMYSLLGAAWFLAAAFVMEALGVSFRDDAIERRNPAAALVVIGAMAGHAAIYAGANIGNGPGWWTVVIAATIGSAVWFGLWLLFELICSLSDDVTVDRDVPAGIRLSAYALAIGLVCARGAAGDWTSLAQTIKEFWVAWPVLPITAAAIAFERILESRPEHFRRGFGVSAVIAAAYLVAAVIAVDLAGPLPHNPQYDNLGSSSPP